MPFPELTHLQFFVIGQLVGGEQPGRHIRRELERQGVKTSGPAFYQLMARIEGAGWVEGHTVPIELDSHAVRVRRYRVTEAGVRAWEDAMGFYRSFGPALASDSRA